MGLPRLPPIDDPKVAWALPLDQAGEIVTVLDRGIEDLLDALE